MTFHLMFVQIILNSVCVAEWPPFGKELPTRLTICSLCISTILYLVISRFGFEGGIWALIAPVPCHCILVTFLKLACINAEHLRKRLNLMKHWHPKVFMKKNLK